MVYEALRRGVSCEHIFDITKIDKWFLYKLLNIAEVEKRLRTETLTHELYVEAKTPAFWTA